MPGRKTFVGTATETTLAAGINSTDTTITVANGSTYGAPSVGAPMVIVVGAETASEEQILISGRSSNVLTVAASGRNWHAGGGTTGVSHALGEVVRHVLDADSINDANRHVNVDTDDDHSQYHNDARHDVTARHTFGAGLGTPAAAGAVLLTGTGTAGSGTVPSRSDHGHAYSPPACRVGNSGSQTLVDATGLVVLFNTERFDNDTMHDNVTSNERITIKTAGLYLFTFTGLITVGTPDYVSVTTILNINGTPVSLNGIGAYADGTVDVYVSHTGVWKCAVNDYATITLRQNNTSNTSRTLVGGVSHTPEFAAVWVGVG